MRSLNLFLLFFMVSGLSLAEEDDYFFCGWYMPDQEYFNLFLQEIVDPEYYPFLRTDETLFYTTKRGAELKNENLEEWQAYLGLSYEETRQLVFKSSREQLLNLIQQESPPEELSFANANFVRRHKQALLYLAYAKYLEPYMRITPGSEGSYYWRYEKSKTVEDLNDDRIEQVLQQSWKAEKDKELKLRYGYQLVRYAHYTRDYQQALNYFETYVEALDYRPVMYYYALEQKAGAESGMGNYDQANRDFIKVFSNTADRKTSAYKSLRIRDEGMFNTLLSQPLTSEERDNLYFILGFNQFNNPLSSFHKIIENSPDAPQAKVLMARAINDLERDYFPIRYYCPYNDPDCLKNLKDRRLPINFIPEIHDFLKATSAAVQKQIDNPKVKEKSFWYLTRAYLSFMDKETDHAREFLAAVIPETEFYDQQKKKLALLIELVDQSSISPEFETQLLLKYGKLWGNPNSPNFSNSTGSFVRDLLANRYLLQGDYAKAFLLNNTIDDLEFGPDSRLFEAIKQLYDKPDKNDFETYLFANALPNRFTYENYKKRTIGKDEAFDWENYLNYMEGIIRLRKGELTLAKTAFDRLPDTFNLTDVKNEERYGASIESFNGFSDLPNTIFGSRAVGYLDQMGPVDTLYLKEFDFIKNKMDMKEMVDILLQLKTIGDIGSDRAAMANYLLGNFFQNTSLNGYFRHVLRFDINNRNGVKYRERENPIDFDQALYLKYYGYENGYQEHPEITLSYAEKGLSQTQDQELGARLTFLAAQAELEQFYDKGVREYRDSVIDSGNRYTRYNYRGGINSDKFIEYRLKNYRTYFQKLQKDYPHTSYYEELQSNCKSFEYYTTHF